MKANAWVRWTTVAAVVIVAIVCGWVSYTHGHEVADAHHEGGIVGVLYPLTIDGLVYSASMVLLDAARRVLDRPPLATWVLFIGIMVTLVVNVWAGVQWGNSSAIIAAWPAVALVLSYEMLMMLVRGHANIAQDKAGAGKVTGAKAQEGQTSQHADVESEAEAARLLSQSQPGSLPSGQDKAKRARHAKGAPTIEAVEREFYQEIARGEIPSLQEIQSRLRVGKEKATSYRQHISQVTRATREAAPAIRR